MMQTWCLISLMHSYLLDNPLAFLFFWGKPFRAIWCSFYYLKPIKENLFTTQ